ncbi:MAG: hypothetical protein Tsb0014_35620 [Pleurocapsa sp.]
MNETTVRIALNLPASLVRDLANTPTTYPYNSIEERAIYYMQQGLLAQQKANLTPQQNEEYLSFDVTRLAQELHELREGIMKQSKHLESIINDRSFNNDNYQ